jgi:hypothetical protein
MCVSSSVQQILESWHGTEQDSEIVYISRFILLGCLLVLVNCLHIIFQVVTNLSHILLKKYLSKINIIYKDLYHV